MRDETRKKVKSLVDNLARSGPTMVEVGQLRDLMTLADAEALLDAPDVPEPLPSKHANVNARGHSTYTGPVQPLGRGYRVEHHFAHYQDDGSCALRRQVCDIFAVHSIEYLSDDEWAEHLGALERQVTDEKALWRRRNEWPEGYEPLVDPGVNGPRYGFKRPDATEEWGERYEQGSRPKCGWTWIEPARAAAWSEFDQASEKEGS